MGFTDFSEIRANWGNLSTADKDEFLGDMALMMLGEKIAVVPAVNMPPSNWQYAKEIIGLTPAKTLLWVTPAAQVLFLAAIGFALYRGAYASAVVLLVAGYFITSKIRYLFTRHAVTKAAASGQEAFVGLWTVKAFALEVAGGKGFYDPLSGNKWQDVVLIAAGWPENASQKIQTREEALNELLSKVKSTA